MMHLVHEHKVCKFVEPRKHPPRHATWLLQFARYGYVLISAIGVSGNRSLALVYARDTRDDG